MTGLVDWAAARARMVIAFIVLSLLAGTMAYTGLPKEGEPDIEIPALFVSVVYPGISAEDSEKLLVKVMETELSDLDGLKKMTGTASENYAGVALEFEFGWDKTKILADVRDAMSAAEAFFPEGAEKYTVNEVNFSEFPIIIVNLSGAVPERTMARLAKDLQDRLEELDAVLEAGIAGNRDEMVEVVIDPLRLEAYNITAHELITVVRNNNQLIAAGEIETAKGTFSVKLLSSFGEPRDIYNLPVKTNGDRVVTLGDLAEISLTFEDRTGTARFNGENTVALQVVKRKGFNAIDTADLVRETVATAAKTWPPELQAAVKLGTSNDQSRVIASMVRQLEGSVLTAIALVMIVMLATLGVRPSLLVGFAIPTSFLLCFALLALMGVAVSNMVMFGLILAVGMLVDGAIVVVEYADKRIREGAGPMHAYVEAAKRMFWPVISSTATTLCAFLPMLFWPGVPGQFMRMLPVTLIFVLSASLLVALVYLPVIGGVTGRLERSFETQSALLRRHLHWGVRLALVPLALILAVTGAMMSLNPSSQGFAGAFPGLVVLSLGLVAMAVTFGAAPSWHQNKPQVKTGYKRSRFGRVVHMIVGNPVMPLAAIAAVFMFIMATFLYFGSNNKGVEFFVESEPETALVYVRARGNLSLSQKDELVQQVENITLAHPNVKNAFAFAGDGGLNNNTGGAKPPLDTVGQVQLELHPWEDRATARETWFTIPILGIDIKRNISDPEADGDRTINELTTALNEIPGIKIEILALERGPASAKPVHLRIKGDDFDAIKRFTELTRTKFNNTPGLKLVEDTLPLPGIDWQIDVDVERAGRYGADVATVGAMVQLVTRGILLDTMRVDSSDEEIEIRVRLPESERVLSTLDTLKIRTLHGLVPLSNFITRKPVEKLAQIDRVDQTRFFDIKAGIQNGLMIYSRQPIGEDGKPDPMKAVTFGVGQQLTQDQIDQGAPYNFTYEKNPTGLFAFMKSPTAYYFNFPHIDNAESLLQTADMLKTETAILVPVPLTANERIAELTKWLDSGVLPAGIEYEWTGDAEDQKESSAFLQQAFLAALGLMFIILLAQFNSIYNSILVLLAVILSTTGVLIGMLVMGQPFSIIMTGTGIVALAGIVVNNNIVLIDTYQDYSRYMPRIEAITRTAEARIRPVLLTTITTMAGLAPMMFGLSLDFFNGGYSFNSPTALWWKQLATAVVFGLGIATVLTLIFTPSMLALRIWVVIYAKWAARALAMVSLGRGSQAAQDWALRLAARQTKAPEIIWGKEAWEASGDTKKPNTPLRAAE